jgi:hypothetical protein
MGKGAGIYRLSRLDIETKFPALSSSDYQITSPATPTYNCIAWAAREINLWWWPDSQYTAYWPAEAPREEKLDAFITAYGMIGFTRCDNSDLEEGFEKVAIYVDISGKPTHAARQLISGRWTSKLGAWEDIDHEKLDDVCGQQYGVVAVILKRPRPADSGN